MLERFFSGVLTLCCIAMLLLIARRELSERGPAVVSPTAPAKRVEAWDSLLAAGTTIGNNTGRVGLVVFSDFECPGCRAFSSTLAELRTRFRDTLTVRILHYPLRQHRFAYRAAQAAECAQQQRAFTKFHDLLYAKQDSIGVLTWEEFARRASVPDVEKFKDCTASTTSGDVDRDTLWAARTGILKTPSIILDGWLLDRTPSLVNLTKYVEDLASGRVPKSFLQSGGSE